MKEVKVFGVFPLGVVREPAGFMFEREETGRGRK